jgi:hypothetical protein
LKTIEEFIEKLSQFQATAMTFNPYQFPQQKTNLLQYLKYHQAKQAKILCIGEAAGHKGCRFSGIPFTSGFILANHSIYKPIQSNFQYHGIEHIKENSAKIIYEFFEQNPQAFDKILLWNIFPFHPHQPNVELSNRTPTRPELVLGSEYLRDLLTILEIKYYFPIGLSAHKSLQKMQKENIVPEFAYKLIRHPSYGGKKDCIEGLTSIFLKYG